MSLPAKYYRLMNIPGVESINNIIKITHSPPIEIWVCDGIRCEKAAPAKEIGYSLLQFRFADGTPLNGADLLDLPRSNGSIFFRGVSHGTPQLSPSSYNQPGFYIHENDFERVKGLLPPPSMFFKAGASVLLDKPTLGGKRRQTRRRTRKSRRRVRR